MGFWGQCKICKEKDQRLIDAKEQIKFLRNYINPTSADAPLMTMEAQAILNGSLNNIIDIKNPSVDKQKELDDIKKEAERMLSGDHLGDE